MAIRSQGVAPDVARSGADTLFDEAGLRRFRLGLREVWDEATGLLRRGNEGLIE